MNDQISDIISNFHLMRPEFLWAIIPAALLLLLLARKQMAQHSWQAAVDSELLTHLLNGEVSKPRRWPLAFMAFALVIGIVAMAGPSWQKVNMPVHQRSEALVIALDLSISMYAEDTKPSRIKQAQYKIRDLLAQRKEGQTALIVFAGDAFVVAPLTDDVNTLINMLSTLEPRIMPLPGSNPLSAISKANELLAGAGISQGRILLVTDGVMDYQLPNLEALLNNNNHSLSILALGTKQGAPIPAPNGGFMKDQTGEIIVPKLDSGPLRKLAKATGGRYQKVRLDDKDVAALVEPEPKILNEKRLEETVTLERNFDTWQDAGFYLVIALLPLSLLLFRRGWLLCLPFLLILPSEQAQAFEWQDLWKTKNQQAQEAMQAEDYEQASKLFETPDWQAAAEYRAGNYEAAAELFSQQSGAEAKFNQGNALAKAGNLEAALKSYEQALEQNPNNKDFQKNHSIVKQLLEQQQEQEQQDKQDQDKSDEKQDGEGEKNQDSQDQQQGEGDKQNQQDGENQQSQDQQQQDGEQQQSDQNQQGQEDQSNQDSQQSQQEQNAEEKEQQAAEPKEGEEQSEAEQQQAEQTEQEKAEQEAAAQQAMMQEAENMDTEEKQALRQWLRKVPDDPSGLLRRKFNAQHQQRQQRGETQERRDVAPY